VILNDLRRLARERVDRGVMDTQHRVLESLIRLKIGDVQPTSTRLIATDSKGV
jgi:hypothetical protein